MYPLFKPGRVHVSICEYESMENSDVIIHLYDMSRGLAKINPALLADKDIAGMWHVSVVVYGQEYFFSRNGVVNTKPVSHFGISDYLVSSRALLGPQIEYSIWVGPE